MCGAYRTDIAVAGAYVKGWAKMRKAMLSVMSVVLLVHGCGSTPGGGSRGGTAQNPARRNPPTITPGTYSGMQSCMSTAPPMNGGMTPPPITGALTITIGATGLPVENGKEVATGDSGTFSLAAFTGTSMVTAVQRTDNGVMVSYALTLSVSLGGFAIQSTGTQQDDYTVTSATTLHRRRTQMFALTGGLPINIPLSSQCDADLTRAAGTP
jgi:hypothetical protein